MEPGLPNDELTWHSKPPRRRRKPNGRLVSVAITLGVLLAGAVFAAHFIANAADQALAHHDAAAKQRASESAYIERHYGVTVSPTDVDQLPLSPADGAIAVTVTNRVGTLNCSASVTAGHLTEPTLYCGNGVPLNPTGH
jgi:hypothetical protein